LKSDLSTNGVLKRWTSMISKPQQWTVFQGKFLIRKKLKDETDFFTNLPTAMVEGYEKRALQRVYLFF